MALTAVPTAAPTVALTVAPTAVPMARPMRAPRVHPAVTTVVPMVGLTVVPMVGLTVEPMAGLTVEPMVEPMAALMVPPPSSDPWMTTHVQDRAPSLHAGRPVLSRCVAGDLTTFVTDVWGRRPLVSGAGELPAGSAPFSPEAVDELVADRGLRTPFLRVAKNGTTLGDREFTSGGGVGATIADQLSDDKLLRLFADGATIVLQGLHRTWAPLVTFSQELAAELGHPVQVNAYVTPAHSQGFSDHYDVHDVFVIQVQGEKRWMIRPPVHPSPLRDHAWTDHRAEVERAALAEPMLDVVLCPGDVLYLPRGFLHAAKARGGVSTHLTVGIHTWTRYTLAEQLVAEALAVVAKDAEVRASLPLGADVSDGQSISAAVEDVRAALVHALDGVTSERVAGRMGRAASSAQRAAPVHPLAQLSAAESLDPSTVVQLRSHLRAHLERRGTAAVVVSRAGQFPLEDDAQTRCVAWLLDGVAASVAELVERHGEVQPLVRRLLLAGVLVAR